MIEKPPADIMQEFLNASGVINTKKLFSHLYGKKTKTRGPSAPSPPEQSVRQYREGKEQETLSNQVMAFHERNTSEPTYVHAVIELLFLYGLRISEALEINSRDITAAGTIHIRGKKGSHDRYVRPVLYASFWELVRSTPLEMGGIYSRQYFYRVLKKYGFYALYGNNVNMSVTHMFRHEYARDVMSQFKNEENVQKSLGQKSKKSAKHYVSNKKK